MSAKKIKEELAEDLEATEEEAESVKGGARVSSRKNLMFSKSSGRKG